MNLTKTNTEGNIQEISNKIDNIGNPKLLSKNIVCNAGNNSTSISKETRNGNIVIKYNKSKSYIFCTNMIGIDYESEKDTDFIIFIRNNSASTIYGTGFKSTTGIDWNPANKPIDIFNTSTLKSGESASYKFKLSDVYSNGDKVNIIFRDENTKNINKDIEIEWFVCKYNSTFDMSRIPDIDTMFKITDLSMSINTLQDDAKSIEARIKSIEDSQSNIVKIKNSKMNCFVNNSASTTQKSATWDEYNNIVLSTHSTSSYAGVYLYLGTYADIKGKKLRIVLKNNGDKDAAVSFYISKESGSWNDNNIFTSAAQQNIVSENIAIYDIALNLNKTVDGSYTIEDETGLYLMLDSRKNNDSLSLIWYAYYVPSTDDENTNIYESNFKVSYVKLASEKEGIESVAHANRADFADNAGYTQITGSNKYTLKTMKNYTCPGVSFKVKDNCVIFDIPEIKIKKVGATRENWVYALFTYDITELVRTDTTLYIECENSNYSGNNSTSWIINHCQLTGNSVSWGNVYCAWADRLGDGVNTSVQIKLSDFKDLPTDKNVYLLFGIESNGTLNSSTNEYEYFPATTFKINIYKMNPDSKVIATKLDGFDPSNVYTKDEVDKIVASSGKYITCWGDSLTAGGGWTSRLQQLTGMTVYNGGTGGENARTIVARQGADAMMVTNLTIPATTDPVTVAVRATDSGIATVSGQKVTPLLQGGAHVNPCKIGDVLGTLRFTGSNHADMTGIWTFTRSEAGEAVTIKRPTVIRTDFDMNKNSPYLQIIYIGQNGGYDNNDDLIRMHRLMIEHSNAKFTIILGLSSGSAATRKDYEAAMKKEFGRYFISLREYLSTPIYDTDGKTIKSCYGLDDQNLEPGSKEYNGTTYVALTEIASGTVPHQILADSVHYTSGTKDVIGDLIYKRCKELNIF